MRKYLAKGNDIKNVVKITPFEELGDEMLRLRTIEQRAKDVEGMAIIGCWSVCASHGTTTPEEYWQGVREPLREMWRQYAAALSEFIIKGEEK